MALEETAKYKMAGEGKISAVKIEFGKNDEVIIRIPYNQELIRKIKMISGRRWNPQGKCWEVPYSEDLIAKLQSLFGENLVIDPYYKSSKTTEIYIHVSNKNIGKIKSPLDSLQTNGGEND